MKRLKTNQEGTYKSAEGEIFNSRIYKDGCAKLETANSIEFFDTIPELENYISSKGLVQIEVLTNA